MSICGVWDRRRTTFHASAIASTGCCFYGFIHFRAATRRRALNDELNEVLSAASDRLNRLGPGDDVHRSRVSPAMSTLSPIARRDAVAEVCPGDV
jgi:hypothetical protein